MQNKVFLLSLIFLASVFQVNAFDLSKFEHPKTTTIELEEVKNPGFELGNEGWRMPKEFKVVQGAGITGTAALYYKRTSPEEPYRTCNQSFKATPGAIYELELWVKWNVKGPSNPHDFLGVGIGIDYSSNGKWISGGQYAGGLKGTSDWQKIVLTSKAPNGATNCGIGLYLNKNGTGEVWFDDISFRVLEDVASRYGIYSLNPLNSITSDNGKMAFAFTYDNDGVMNKAPEGELYCQVEILELKKVFTAQIEKNRAIFDFGKIPLGTYKMAVSALDIKNKKVLSMVDIPLSSHSPNRKSSKNSCIIDEKGRAWVDGKLFMPIGIFMGLTFKEDIDIISAGGFNCVMPYASLSSVLYPEQQRTPENMLKSFDYCNEKNIKVIFSLKDLYSGLNYSLNKWADVKGFTNIIKKVVPMVKDHPALLAWYTCDELAPNRVYEIQKNRELINSIDPMHPTWVLTNQLGSLSMYGPATDVIGLDVYPVYGKNTDNMEKIGYGLKNAKATGKNAIWFAPQVCNWKSFKPSSDPYFNEYRSPSIEEMRSMFIYQASLGAKGFICYDYSSLKRKPLPEDNFKKEWPKITEAVKCLLFLESFIMSDKEIVKVPATSMNGETCVVEMTANDGKKAILISGIVSGENKVKFHLEGDFSSKYGKTIKENGEWVFTGNGISSDILTLSQ